MSEGRRSQISPSLLLHAQTPAKRVCEDGAEEERNSPKKIRPEGLNPAFLAQGDHAEPAVTSPEHLPEKKTPWKRGRKKRNQSPHWLYSRGGRNNHPQPSHVVAPPQPQPSDDEPSSSSSGMSLVAAEQSPCKTSPPDKRVRFGSEMNDAGMRPPVAATGVVGHRRTSHDRGVQVKPERIVVMSSSRAVQTLGCACTARYKSDGNQPVASSSRTTDLGGSGADRPQGDDAKRRRDESRQHWSGRDGEAETAVFAEHSYVHLELVIEFLLLCLVMWFFKYR